MQWALVAAALASGIVSCLALLYLRVPTHPLRSDIACQCGKVQGHVDASAGLHFVCYCDDCQAFAEHTCKTCKSPVDDFGGTDIVQVFPSEIRILQSKQHLKIGKLTEKTKVLRVFASCCGTPMFNTSDNSAFLGLLTHTLKSDTQLKPPDYRIQAKFAKMTPPGPAARIIPVEFVVAFFLRTLVFFRKRAHPSPVDDTSIPRLLFK
ncbi:hypothetical protein LEN26_000529 [Aphanomyces euteiches]|nr:hypothetical protein LEN26_000529 [Aphanomyces euteiches]